MLHTVEFSLKIKSLQFLDLAFTSNLARLKKFYFSSSDYAEKFVSQMFQVFYLPGLCCAKTESVWGITCSFWVNFYVVRLQIKSKDAMIAMETKIRMTQNILNFSFTFGSAFVKNGTESTSSRQLWLIIASRRIGLRSFKICSSSNILPENSFQFQDIKWFFLIMNPDCSSQSQILYV